jgi:hypothetical protein
VTVRFIGTFLTDPLDVPAEVLDYVAEQLGIADPSCARRYTEREKTRMEHAWEIQREYGLRDFGASGSSARYRRWPFRCCFCP